MAQTIPELIASQACLPCMVYQNPRFGDGANCFTKITYHIMYHMLWIDEYTFLNMDIEVLVETQIDQSH